MRDNDFLSLQANIICLLLALIGSAAIVKHPDWFGGVPEIVTGADEGAARTAPSP
jgi:hypothetical protein